MQNNDIEQIMLRVFAQLDEKNDIVPFFKISEDKLLAKQCESISLIKVVIVKAVQIGNYKKAMLYLGLLRKILFRINEQEATIKEKVSKYVLGE